MNLYPQEIKELLEALLLCSAEPLSLSTLSNLTGFDSPDILEALDQLQQDYHAQGMGFEICEIAGGWMFATFPKHAPFIERLIKPRLSSLTQASLEVLSIIAYRQPITRGEMEEIRGVNCDSPVNTLLERGLIREGGRKDVPGRPITFVTTMDFLKYFGLTSLQDLPALAIDAVEGEDEVMEGEGMGEAVGMGEAMGEAAGMEEAGQLAAAGGEDEVMQADLEAERDLVDM